MQQVQNNNGNVPLTLREQVLGLFDLLRTAIQTMVRNSNGVVIFHALGPKGGGKSATLTTLIKDGLGVNNIFPTGSGPRGETVDFSKSCNELENSFKSRGFDLAGTGDVNYQVQIKCAYGSYQNGTNVSEENVSNNELNRLRVNNTYVERMERQANCVIICQNVVEYMNNAANHTTNRTPEMWNLGTLRSVKAKLLEKLTPPPAIVIVLTHMDKVMENKTQQQITRINLAKDRLIQQYEEITETVFCISNTNTKTNYNVLQPRDQDDVQNAIRIGNLIRHIFNSCVRKGENVRNMKIRRDNLLIEQATLEENNRRRLAKQRPWELGVGLGGTGIGLGGITTIGVKVGVALIPFTGPVAPAMPIVGGVVGFVVGGITGWFGGKYLGEGVFKFLNPH